MFQSKITLKVKVYNSEMFTWNLCFVKVNIFMTHLSNYGNDRLALYTFESVIKFVQCWTNLEVKTVAPLELAKVYFDMYPDEVNPIWRVRFTTTLGPFYTQQDSLAILSSKRNAF